MRTWLQAWVHQMRTWFYNRPLILTAQVQRSLQFIHCISWDNFHRHFSYPNDPVPISNKKCSMYRVVSDNATLDGWSHMFIADHTLNEDFNSSIHTATASNLSTSGRRSVKRTCITSNTFLRAFGTVGRASLCSSISVGVRFKRLPCQTITCPLLKSSELQFVCLLGF